MTHVAHRMAVAGLAVLAVAALPGPATAADAPPSSAVPDHPKQRIDRTWEFLVAPYAVGANIVGTSQVGRLPATDLDVGTNDILENLRFGGMIRAEALYAQTLGAMLDIAYMNLGSAADTPLTGGRVRVGAGQLILEGMVFYRAVNTDSTSVDVYGGGRYWDIDLDLDATGTIAGDFNITRGDTWTDPVIGLRAVHRFNDRWSINGRGDIGGFGVASDFSWNVQAGIGYHFNDVWSTHLQYKALMVDFDNDKTGPGRFTYDTITHGPLLGVAARF